MIKTNSLYEFCSGKITDIENFEGALNDRTQSYVLHHRLELHPDGSLRFTRESLKALGLYYNRPPRELIFMPKTEHARMHRKAVWGNSDFHGSCKQQLDAAREKRKFDENWRKKAQESHQGTKWSEARRKAYKYHTPWNKGLTKETDGRVRQYAETRRLRMGATDDELSD